MKEGEILGIVGESGSGKTQTALSVLGLLKKHEEISAGEILFEGKNLAEFSQKELEAVRGKDISMIFQEPMTSLNPVLPVGQQVKRASGCILPIQKRNVKNEPWTCCER